MAAGPSGLRGPGEEQAVLRHSPARPLEGLVEPLPWGGAGGALGLPPTRVLCPRPAGLSAGRLHQSQAEAQLEAPGRF